MKDGFLSPDETVIEEAPEKVEVEGNGTIITPLPPDMITAKAGVVMAKSPDEYDRDQAEILKKARRKLGL